MNMLTPMTMDAEFTLESIWMAWMLCICALNGATAFACVAFVLHKTNKSRCSTSSRNNEEPKRPIDTPKRMTRQNAIVHEPIHAEALVICGKRKTRDLTEAPFVCTQATNEITQGRWKQRRIIHTIAKTSSRSIPRRARSFDFEATGVPTCTPLRRVVSCGDVAVLRRFETKPKTHTKPTHTSITPTTKTPAPAPSPCVVASSMTALPREIRLRDVLSSAKAVVFAKLREAARNAVDEMLTSIISFLTYGMLLFVVRQYSAVAVGVSLDLGAFSIEL